MPETEIREQVRRRYAAAQWVPTMAAAVRTHAAR